MTHEDAQNRTQSDAQPESGSQTADAAQGPLVERMAEAIIQSDPEIYPRQVRACAPWNPVRRGECNNCGSDAGPKTDDEAEAPDAESPSDRGAASVEDCPSASSSSLATCMRCGRGMNPGDEMCCPATPDQKGGEQ